MMGFYTADSLSVAVDNAKLVEELTNGHRLEKPVSCGDKMYAIMKSCWEFAPNRRPVVDV